MARYLFYSVTLLTLRGSLPQKHKIVVIGNHEDMASVLKGANVKGKQITKVKPFIAS
jgi:hypothetical protein